MCGIFGVVAPRGRPPSIGLADAGRLVDTMARRGPDGRGLSLRNNVLFGHRRLAIVDVESGAQPFASPCGRYALVYNGELYNDAEVRADLTTRGVAFRTRCDTETVLHALATWGVDALPRLRGMFALGFYDFERHQLILARDPLGMKPLYVAVVGEELVFSSHLPALLGHPNARPSPDYAVLSAFLTTLRTTLGHATLFEGVSTLQPGEVWTVQARDAGLEVTAGSFWREPAVEPDMTWDEAVRLTRDTVTESVLAHLRSDVPRCTLLSGGLDSSIIASVALEAGAPDLMRTWCAGGPHDTDDADPVHAAQVSKALGTQHTTVRVDEASFHSRWQALTEESGLPVSTPNETAIFAVAEDLRSHATVALSGEGADELFGGYIWPMLRARDGIRQEADPVSDYLTTTGWVTAAQKPAVLCPNVWEAAERDAGLRANVHAQLGFTTGDPWERQLRLHRRVNLTGLLGRLDTATMAARVEGRTPFADVRVAEAALRIPMRHKLHLSPEAAGLDAARTLALGVTGKAVLREAFRTRLPAATVARPKVSFPLPFQGWLQGACEVLGSSSAVQGVFTPDVIRAVRDDPERAWTLAWPVLSAARWLHHHWG